MKLIGYAFQTGRIDFSKKDNPWAFTRIESDMKSSQKDRIVVNPKQAPIELRSAPVNTDEPEWMPHMEQVLQSSDRIVLQYKSGGFLRFRKATHDARRNRTFVTIGNQDEADLYASENWNNVRYLYANRRDIVRFDVVTMITHRPDQGVVAGTRAIEMNARLETLDGEPMITFDSSGQNATTDIVEWRGTVREGQTGKYMPADAHMAFQIKQVNRPFTFLHEDREEFRNHSYTFCGDKTQQLLKRLIRKNLAT